jgi:hypothetical protein
MQHERRSGKRQRISLSVDLCQPGRETHTHHACNLTPDGMLLENDAQLFEPGARIELQVRHDERTWHIPASVTHCNSDCIGIMFRQRQAELFRTLTRSSMRPTRSSGGRYLMLHRSDRQSNR